MRIGLCGYNRFPSSRLTATAVNITAQDQVWRVFQLVAVRCDRFFLAPHCRHATREMMLKSPNSKELWSSSRSRRCVRSSDGGVGRGFKRWLLSGVACDIISTDGIMTPPTPYGRVHLQTSRVTDRYRTEMEMEGDGTHQDDYAVVRGQRRYRLFFAPRARLWKL